MRTITAAQQAVLDSSGQAEFCRVSVKDAGGTFRDLTTYPGFNALQSVQWKQEITSPCATFEMSLARELFQLSLNPFVDNGVNRGFNPAATFAPLIKQNREVKIEVAIVAMDTQPGAGDWMEVFRGKIDAVDSASGWDVRVSGRDQAGRLAQQYIKLERVYSFAVDAGVPKSARVWSPQMVVTAGEYLIPASRAAAVASPPATTASAADPGYNKILKCHTGGTTGTTEPVWTTGALQADGGTVLWDYVGAPSTAGFDVETIMQGQLDDNKLTGDSTVTLYTPASPGWSITQFMQQRGFTLDAVRALATQIGWDLRQKWKVAASAFALTLYEPDRAFQVGVDTPDHIFTAAQYENPTKLSVDIATIRNSVRVIYADKTDLWPDGTPKRKQVDVSDAGSITENGELWMELQEDQNGNIDTPTEAAALANSALSDCANPTAELAVQVTRGFPWVELNDMYQFGANGLHFTSDQTLAVTSCTQYFDGGRLKTILETRGLPTIGADVHLAKEFHPAGIQKQETHRVDHFGGDITASTRMDDIVGGQRITITETRNAKSTLVAEYEIHVYKTPGSPLDSTTLAGLTTGKVFEAGNLDPGDSYSQRVVPRYYNAGQLVRGQPSSEQSFVPGYLKPKHINTELFRGETPLNGSFEAFTRAEAFTVPPDQWEMQTGTWATDAGAGPAKGGVAARDGARYLRFINTSVATAVRSKWFPVNGGHVHELAAWVYRNGGSNSFDLQMEWVTASKAAISTSTLTTSVTSLTDSAWNALRTIFTAPDTAAFARVIVAKSSANTDAFHVDGVKVTWLGEPWTTIPDGSMFNSWVTDTTVAYRFSQGELEVMGAVKNGTLGLKAITLPIVPTQLKRWGTICGFGNFGELQVTTAGDVIPATGHNSWVSLDCIRFRSF